MRLAFKLILGCSVATFIIWSNSRREESVEATGQVETIQQQRDEAEGMLLKVCTNEVPGLNRIIDVSVDDSADLASKWTGRATVEYVNHLGGADRTNLLFIYSTAYGHLACMLDARLIYQQQTDELNRRLEAAKSGQ